jgi:hypothetical protein
MFPDQGAIKAKTRRKVQSKVTEGRAAELYPHTLEYRLLPPATRSCIRFYRYLIRTRGGTHLI